MSRSANLRATVSINALVAHAQLSIDGAVVINDEVTTTDVMGLAFDEELPDTVAIGELFDARLAINRSFADTVTATDVVSGVGPVEFSPDPDAAAATDQPAMAYGMAKADSTAGATDAPVKSIAPAYADSVTASESVTLDQIDGGWPQTMMLLHGNGANGGQNNTFTDTSANAIAVTRNGDTTQGSLVPYAPCFSGFFDGSSYLQGVAGTSYAFGSGDFTVEAWIYLTSLPSANVTIWTNRTGGTGTACSWLGINSSNQIAYFENASIANDAAALTIGQWYHVVVARQGTTLRIFKNGTQVASVANSTNITGNECNVAGDPDGGAGAPRAFTGFISNARVVKGTAVYTAAFTPPTSPLTAISGTTLLTCKSFAFYDVSSTTSLTWTGTPQVTVAQPFSVAVYTPAGQGGAAIFDGTGDYLSTAANAGLALGAGDFSIECWVYRTSGAATTFGIAGTGSGAGGWQLTTTSGDLKFIKGGGVTAITAAGVIPALQWSFITVTRISGTTTLYVNGVSRGTNADATNYTVNTVGMGAADAAGTSPFTGLVTNLRLIKGTTTVSGAVPATPLTAITNTQLLLNCTDAAIYDNTRQVPIYTLGNAQTSTAQSKYNGSSIKFDGTGDQLSTPVSGVTNLSTMDFTVEAWVYIAANSALNGSSLRVATLLSCYPASGTITGWALNVDGDGTTTGIGLVFANIVSGTAYTVTYTGAISQGAWHHVAVARQGTTTRLFLDGTQVASGTLGNQTISPTGQPLRIGGTQYTGAAQELNGYMGEVRITRGLARYTANFTPPGPHPDH